MVLACGLSSGFQVLQVALHYWLQVGVDYYRGGALVFAEFGEDLVGDGKRDGQGLQCFRDGFFVFGICEGEEERDRDRLRFGGGELLCESAQFLRRGLDEDFAVAGGAFVDTEAEIFRDQWLDAVEEEIIELGAGLASDFDGVFEAFGGDECGAGAFAFEQRVGADGGAVEEDDVAFGSDFLECFDDGLRGIGGGRKDFQHAEAAVFSPDAVGEGAAGVDGDAEGLRAARHGTQKSNTGGSARAGAPAPHPAPHSHVSQRTRDPSTPLRAGMGAPGPELHIPVLIS